MECSSVRERLVEHLYGELPPAEDAALGLHLAACGECNDRARELAAARAELGAWRLRAPPALERPAPSPRGFRRARPLATGALAGAAAFLLLAAARARVEFRDRGLTVAIGAAAAEPARAAVDAGALAAAVAEAVDLRVAAALEQLSDAALAQGAAAGARGTRALAQEIVSSVRARDPLAGRP